MIVALDWDFAGPYNEHDLVELLDLVRYNPKYHAKQLFTFVDVCSYVHSFTLSFDTQERRVWLEWKDREERVASLLEVWKEVLEL